MSGPAQGTPTAQPDRELVRVFVGPRAKLGFVDAHQGPSGRTQFETLEEALTPADFRHAEIAAFCEPIERLTGRKVRAFLSGFDPEADMASELFILQPPDYDGPSRTSI
jgi:hypothetical protein